MAPTRIGLRRERVALMGAERTDVGGGATTVAPVRLAEVHARVRALQGRSALQARQVYGAEAYEVNIRYPLPAGADGEPVQLRTDRWLVWRGQDLRIVAVAVGERRREVQLTCVAKEAAA